MDPNKNLEEQLKIAYDIIRRVDESEEDLVDLDTDDCIRLAELVSGLHSWLRKGGALPSDWVAGASRGVSR
jgi:hypothetical protein